MSFTYEGRCYSAEYGKRRLLGFCAAVSPVEYPGTIAHLETLDGYVDIVDVEDPELMDEEDENSWIVNFTMIFDEDKCDISL